LVKTKKVSHICDGDARGGLPSSDASETSLVLDDAVWDTHLTAKCRQEKNQLKKIQFISFNLRRLNKALRSESKFQLKKVVNTIRASVEEIRKSCFHHLIIANALSLHITLMLTS
jgi:hypothetical protein